MEIISLEINTLAGKMDLAKHSINLQCLECKCVIKILDFVYLSYKKLLRTYVNLEEEIKLLQE